MNSIYLPQDKANHCIYGAVIALAVLLLATQFPALSLRPRDLALAAAVLAGLAKEALDQVMNMRAVAAGQAPAHGVEFLDIVATASGGVLVWVAAS